MGAARTSDLSGLFHSAKRVFLFSKTIEGSGGDFMMNPEVCEDSGPDSTSISDGVRPPARQAALQRPVDAFREDAGANRRYLK